MYSDSNNPSSPESQIEVVLDGRRVGVPPQWRTLTDIRSCLESRAREQQRVLWLFIVVGEATSPAELLSAPDQSLHILGQSIGLDQMSLQLVEFAIQQTARAHTDVQRAVSHVMINEALRGQELWWNLSQGLKQPLLTLSELPDWVCGPANGSASPMQLRKWQLEQLAGIIQEVDRACQAYDPTALSDALEARVLPWLEGLQEMLALLRETLLIAPENAYCEPRKEGRRRGNRHKPNTRN
jgi:hypothetical protein